MLPRKKSCRFEGKIWRYHALLRCRKGRFNAVSEFSPFVQNFFVVPSREEKTLYVPEKKVSEPGKNSVAGAGPLGRSGPGGPERAWRAGPAWRAWPGWGLGPGRIGRGGGGGTCVSLHKNVRRNRLKCLFAAEYWGEKSVFFTGFFQRGTRFFLVFPLEKNPVNVGKMRCYQNDSEWCRFFFRIQKKRVICWVGSHLLRSSLCQLPESNAHAGLPKSSSSSCWQCLPKIQK